jgi:hypothetical protein
MNRYRFKKVMFASCTLNSRDVWVYMYGKTEFCSFASVIEA